MSDPWAWRSNMDIPGGIPTGGYQPPNMLRPGPPATGSERIYNALRPYMPESYVWDRPMNAFAHIAAPFTTDVYDQAQEVARGGNPAMLAMSLLPGMKPAGKAAQTAENALAKGIRAYHGSPHSFDRFDMSKIGTGEGAQAYGHGLYFAENERVAKSYRDTLGARQFDSASFADHPDLPNVVRDYLKKSGYDASDDSVAAAVKQIKTSGWSPPGLDYDRLGTKPPGHMYEVNIKANPEDFLDWDKPLAQQSEKVRDAALGIRNKAARAEYEARGFPEPLIQEYLANATRADKTGGQVVQGMKGAGQSGDFSQALREAGIPGIRYLDQGSRTAGEGSRNYVVFDDALIEILRKYGLMPPAAVGVGAAAYGQGDQQ